MNGIVLLPSPAVKAAVSLRLPIEPRPRPEGGGVMIKFEDLAEFFPAMVEVRANQGTAEELQRALVKDVEKLRAEGQIGPLEKADEVVFITRTVPPQVSFNDKSPITQRLLMSRSR
jgi:hypothetical protein